MPEPPVIHSFLPTISTDDATERVRLLDLTSGLHQTNGKVRVDGEGKLRPLGRNSSKGRSGAGGHVVTEAAAQSHDPTPPILSGLIRVTIDG